MHASRVHYVGFDFAQVLQVRLDVVPHRSGAYLTALGKNWDEYYTGKRSASTRKTARRKQRQLEERGKLQFISVADAAEASRTLGTLVDQKSVWFARMGVGNIFLRPGYREFYRDAVTDPATNVG